MKRTLAAVSGAVVSLALLAGCSGGSSAGGAQGDTIKIGVSYELSGAVATYGDDSVKGIEMAIEEINAAGGVNGKQIEAVKYDTKSEPAEATTLATKLMTQDKVVTIIGPATSGSFKATIPVANQNKVPVVSGSATANDVTVANGKLQEFAFRTCFSDSYQGSAMANYAAEKLSAKTAVVIKDNSSDYAKGLSENFQTTFTEAGGQILGEESYVAGDTDFQAILTRIKSKSFDVIYLPGYYSEVGLIVKQAREMGIIAPILGGDGFDSPKLLELGGAAALNDVYFTNHYSAIDEDKVVQDFIANFKSKYNTDPGAFSALGYDTAYFVAKAIENAEEVTGEGVKASMENTKDFSGVTGEFSVDPETHEPIKTALVIKLENGEQASVDKATA